MKVSESSKILLIGDPRLRKHAAAVVDFKDPAFLADVQSLHGALDDFRKKHGFGRAIAAPQISIDRRLIAVRLTGRRITIVNPEITWASPEMFTVWDDCMCFPFLLVRVRRHRSISIKYQDEQGVERTWDKMEEAEAELLQHEIDHLNGVLALDLAMDKESIVSREVFEKDFAHFSKQADYVIRFLS